MPGPARRPKPTSAATRLTEATFLVRATLSDTLDTLDEVDRLASYAGVETFLLAPQIEAKAAGVRAFVAGLVDQLEHAKRERLLAELTTNTAPGEPSGPTSEVES